MEYNFYLMLIDIQKYNIIYKYINTKKNIIWWYKYITHRKIIIAYYIKIAYYILHMHNIAYYIKIIIAY